MPDVNATERRSKGILSHPAVNANTKDTKTDITTSEVTFDSIYSIIVTGDTARALSTRSLFSNKTIAPIKNNPRAAGSE